MLRRIFFMSTIVAIFTVAYLATPSDAATPGRDCVSFGKVDTYSLTTAMEDMIEEYNTGVHVERSIEEYRCSFGSFKLYVGVADTIEEVKDMQSFVIFESRDSVFCKTSETNAYLVDLPWHFLMNAQPITPKLQARWDSWSRKYERKHSCDIFAS